MKKFLIILILSFFSYAEGSEIEDFEIEGISIGDSLLDFFEESEIIKKFYYNNKKYFSFGSAKYKSENYDAHFEFDYSFTCDKGHTRLLH